MQGKSRADNCTSEAFCYQIADETVTLNGSDIVPPKLNIIKIILQNKALQSFWFMTSFTLCCRWTYPHWGVFSVYCHYAISQSVSDFWICILAVTQISRLNSEIWARLWKQPYHMLACMCFSSFLAYTHTLLVGIYIGMAQKSGMKITCDLPIPLLGVDPKVKNKKMLIHRYINSLSILSPCLSQYYSQYSRVGSTPVTDEWIKKLWHMYTLHVLYVVRF